MVEIAVNKTRLMKKTILILMAFATMLVGCKKVEVKYTYSPTEPRAGQLVKFSNQSSAGESWSWDFGDNNNSILKNPSHTFKKPGTYIVTLMVDSTKHNTCSHVVTVYDTIPTFVVSTDSICHYTDVTLTANVYNPFGYTLSYDWDLPEDSEITSGSTTSKEIVAHFKTYSKSQNDSIQIGLTIVQNGKTSHRIRKFIIHTTKAPSIVMQKTDQTVLCQHMINGYIEAPTIGDSEDVEMIELSSDTIVVFNGVTFRASQMQDIFPSLSIKRMQIDVVTQKWYIFTEEGLFVANFDGQHIVSIDTDATGGICIDNMRNRLYWASNSGLKAMPLVKSKNNLFATTPELYNTISDIDRIVVNNNLK